MAGPRKESIEAARARWRAAREEFSFAALEYERAETLYRKGAISRSDLDEAETRWESLSARAEETAQLLEELRSGTRRERVEAQCEEVQALETRLDSLKIQRKKRQLFAPCLILYDAAKGGSNPHSAWRSGADPISRSERL